MWSELNCGLPADKRGRCGLCSGEVAQLSARCREAGVHKIVDQSRKRPCCAWIMPDVSRPFSTPIPARIRSVVYRTGVLLIRTVLMRCARFCEPMNSGASVGYSIRAATRADPGRRKVRAQLARRFCDTVVLAPTDRGREMVDLQYVWGSCGRGMRFAKASLPSPIRRLR